MGIREVDDLVESSPPSDGCFSKRMLQTCKTPLSAFFTPREDSSDLVGENDPPDLLAVGAVSFDKSSIDEHDQRSADSAEITKKVAETVEDRGSWRCSFLDKLAFCCRPEVSNDDSDDQREFLNTLD